MGLFKKNCIGQQQQQLPYGVGSKDYENRFKPEKRKKLDQETSSPKILL